MRHSSDFVGTRMYCCITAIKAPLRGDFWLWYCLNVCCCRFGPGEAVGVNSLYRRDGRTPEILRRFSRRSAALLDSGAIGCPTPLQFSKRRAFLRQELKRIKRSAVAALALMAAPGKSSRKNRDARDFLTPTMYLPSLAAPYPNYYHCSRS